MKFTHGIAKLTLERFLFESWLISDKSIPKIRKIQNVNNKILINSNPKASGKRRKAEMPKKS